MEELQKQDPNFSFIAATIQKDMGLSVKLLRIANSIFFGGLHLIRDLKMAVLRLGIQEMKHWISIMLLRDFENPENSELIKVCLLRGKLLALISFELNQGASETDFFLTGLLSSIDVIVNQDMETVLSSLALSGEVKNALLGRDGQLKECLDCILTYERFEFDEARVGLRTWVSLWSGLWLSTWRRSTGLRQQTDNYLDDKIKLESGANPFFCEKTVEIKH